LNTQYTAYLVRGSFRRLSAASRVTLALAKELAKKVATRLKEKPAERC